MLASTIVLYKLAIIRVWCFFNFKYQTVYFLYVVVQWFSYVIDGCDPDTELYLVTPSTNDDGTPDTSIIHIDCIFHTAHLIPIYNTNFLSYEITSHNNYNIICIYYVSKYMDHYAFEVV